MVTAYRVYYTTFDENKHARIRDALEKMFEGKASVSEHKSFIKEFRYVEIRGEKLEKGFEESIARTVREILGEEAYVRVDYINL